MLPLIRRHFEIRYADQDLMIYDTASKYGLEYNRNAMKEIRLESKVLAVFEQEVDEKEQLCQLMWQGCYEAVTIRSRSNPALHRRRLPRRFWRYLTEKNPLRRAP